jgi:hypothetical protein
MGYAAENGGNNTEQYTNRGNNLDNILSTIKTWIDDQAFLK